MSTDSNEPIGGTTPKRKYTRTRKRRMTPQQARLLSNWIRIRRMRLRLTQLELARLAKVSKQYISLLEGNRRPAANRNIVTPSVDVIDRIAEALEAASHERDELRKLAGYVPVSEAIFVPGLEEQSEELPDEEVREWIIRSLNTIIATASQALKMLKQ